MDFAEEVVGANGANAVANRERLGEFDDERSKGA